MDLVLVLSSKCNASCTHCTTSCGPHRTEALSKGEVFRLMDEAVAIEDGKRLRFNITGGEPFLNFDLLHCIVERGAGLGGFITCATNAYWARTDAVASEKLTCLKDAGLAAMSVSVSRFHQQFIPLERVRLALQVAHELGLRTELKGAITHQDLQPDGALCDWKRTLDADRINIFPVLPYLRTDGMLQEEDYYRDPGLPEEKCPGDIVCIEPDGSAMSCCGPGVSKQFLRIGNVREMPLSEIQLRFRTGARQRILREQGPIAFARSAIERGRGGLLRGSYAGPCDLCAHIACESGLRQIADELGASTN